MCMLLALVMVMAMIACGNQTEEIAETDPSQPIYEEALAAHKNGDYETAYTLFSELGDYKESAQMLATIKVEKTGVTVKTTTAEGTSTRNVEYIFKDGNLVKETITHADGTVTKNYYKYNDMNQCTSETLNDPDGGKTVINHFYEDGCKIRSIRTNPNKTKDTFVYTYDESGKLLFHVLTLSDGTVEETVYTYDAAGLLTSIATANSFMSFAYNQFGDLSYEFLTENGQDIHKASYTYTYSYSLN